MKPILPYAVFAVLAVLCSAADFDVRGVPCDIGGCVVDESGALLDGVQIEIVVTKLEELQVIRYTTNITVNGRFRFSFPLVAELDMSASKDGYTRAVSHIGRRDMDADDVVLRLHRAPPPTGLVQVKGVDISRNYSGDGTGVFLETGEITPISESPDLFLSFPDGWTSTDIPPSLILLCVRESGGIVRVPEAAGRYERQDIGMAVEAPASGYQACVGLTPGGSDAFLFYLRTPSGKFGKLQVRVVNVLHQRREVMARVEYFLQPDGTANLNNRDRLQLIRARKRVEIGAQSSARENMERESGKSH